MAKINVKGLVIKQRGDKLYCYWQPNAAERKAGWIALRLGSDIRAAQAACDKQNDEISAWRDGGSRPAKVKAFIKGGTMAQLILKFREARFVPAAKGGLSAKTQTTYSGALDIIERWAGNEQVVHITRARVRTFRNALLKPDANGFVMLHRAGGTMRVLHTLMKFAINEGFLPETATNPAAEQNMPSAPARDQIWSQPAIDLFIAAALEDEQPSMALAIHIGREVTQREGDIIGLTINRWVEIPAYKLDDSQMFDRLADFEPAVPGQPPRRTVRAIRVRQSKTKRWIEVPVIGELRTMMEAAIAQARAMGSMLVLHEMAIPQQFRNSMKFERHLADEMRAQGIDPTPERIAAQVMARREPRPWQETRFQRAVARYRDRAAEMARAQGDEDLATEIEGLQFRDMRRTGVVWLGELGIEDGLIGALTGHKLDEVRDILEVYMPRTTKMAGRAIVQRLERDPTGHAKATTEKKDRA